MKPCEWAAAFTVGGIWGAAFLAGDAIARRLGEETSGLLILGIGVAAVAAGQAVYAKCRERLR